MDQQKTILSLPINYLEALLGEQGRKMIDINKLQIKSKRTGTACCTIFDTYDETTRTFDKIQKLILDAKQPTNNNKSFQVSYVILQKYAGLLMGKEGKNHIAIQNYFGIKLFFNQIDDRFLEVSMTGSLNRILAARYSIAMLIWKVESSPGQKVNAQNAMFLPYHMLIPKASMPLLMGQHGLTHKRMQKDYGVNIGFKFEEIKYDQIPVELSKGNYEIYENVASEISRLVRMTNVGSKGEHEEKMDVPIDKVGLIKGTNCSTINKICDETDTIAYFEEKTSPNRQAMTLVIVGNVAQTSKAIKKVKKLLDKSSNKKAHSARPIQVQRNDETNRFVLERELRDHLRGTYDNIAKKHGLKIAYEDAAEGDVYVIVNGSERKTFLAIQEMLIAASKVDLIQQEFECSVCFEKVPLKEGVACFDFDDSDNENDDKHSFCIRCIINLAKSLVETDQESERLAKGGIGLKCMEHGCKYALLLSEIRWYLDVSTLDRLEEQCMHESIRSANINGLVKCNDCHYILIIEVGDRFICPDCGRIQCRFCPRIYNAEHFGKTCLQVDHEELEKRRREEEELRRQRIEAMEAAQRAEKAEQARLRAAAEEARRKEQILIDNRLSEEFVKTHIRCPNCLKPVEKINGCNHMTCKCGAQFCYKCGRHWSDTHNCG